MIYIKLKNYNLNTSYKGVDAFDYQDFSIKKGVLYIKYSENLDVTHKLIDFCHQGKKEDITLISEPSFICFEEMKIIEYRKIPMENGYDYRLELTIECSHIYSYNKESTFFKKHSRLYKIEKLLGENVNTYK